MIPHLNEETVIELLMPNQLLIYGRGLNSVNDLVEINENESK